VSAVDLPLAGALARERAARTLDLLRRTTLPFLVLLVVWGGIATVGHLPERTLPTPSEALASAIQAVVSGMLPTYVLNTMLRIALGAGLSIAVGIPLGFLIGSVRPVADSLTPLLNFFQALSGIALLPLFIVWFGFTDKTVEAIVLYTAVFPIVGNTVLGLRTLPPRYTEGLWTLGATPWQIVRDVWLPGALPHIVTGVRLGIAYGWREVIAGEMLTNVGGLGSMIFQAQQFANTPLIVAGMVIVGVLWSYMDFAFLRPLEAFTVERWGAYER